MFNEEENRIKSSWWIKFLYFFGIPAGIAIYLIYVQTTVFEAKLNAISADLNSLEVNLAYTIKSDQELKVTLRALMIINQQTCVNTARTEAARQICWNPWSYLSEVNK